MVLKREELRGIGKYGNSNFNFSNIFCSSNYTDNGYKNRKDYLRSLSDDHGVDIEKVLLLADLYGPNEDFDGLVTQIEDIAGN